MAKYVVLGWEISTAHGWGVYGLNLALNWAADPEIESATSFTMSPELIDVDPLRARVLAPFIRRSLEFQRNLQRFANGQMNYGGTFLANLGNDFGMGASAHQVTIVGKPSVGVIFFEEGLQSDAVERAMRFPCTVVGSSWNEKILKAYGIKGVRRVLQGIDPTLFHPGPKQNLFKDRFLIFSGGKAEYRKAQDIILAAFKVFSERHPEAMLVTAWFNMWSKTIQTLHQSKLLQPFALTKAEQIDVYAWAAANKISPDRILDLAFVSNHRMPTVLREMDVALFPNRAEGGTNLVAMECMACGIPVVLSRNTGHVDLIEDGNCYPLDDQRPTTHGFAGVGGVDGWGESQIDEIVERLEQVFTDRAEASRRAKCAADRLAQLTWQATAAQMKSIVMELAS